MNSAREIRQAFFDFFASKGHKIVDSAPIVLKDDPTLMFTNAGMNQFKDIFLGTKKAQHSRVANSQKCLRVSGKHNDLEEVGVDTYHHTMFEMLGNWSFADYFKKDAIQMAWELLTEVYKLDKDRLYVSVFSGDQKDKLQEDSEAFQIWKELIDQERILKFDKKDNFWEMGATGPCGPCSEIHIDLRPDAERNKVDGKTLVNQDHEQVIEVWNLVFIQYLRRKDGSLEDLPEKHVDTGMGFERLVRALNAKTSNYNTDVFLHLIKAIESLCDKQYGANEKQDIAFRVIADHVRAVSFCVADGQLPSNNGAGYVIRRILRRALRYAYSFLDLNEAFMYSLVAMLADQFKGVFSELEAQKEFVSKVIKEEEEQFFKTLEKGIALFESKLKSNNPEKIDGDFAFKLYDTYGFPFDLTALLAKERKLEVDLKAFNKALDEQKQRSKNAAKQDVSDWVVIQKSDQPTTFLGYDQLSCEANLLKYRRVEAKQEVFYQVVFDQTPFYATGGGQVGDSGEMIGGQNRSIEIFSTQNALGETLHHVKEEPKGYEKVTLKVNRSLRISSAKNHSATHLLHQALREVLGAHVEQRGSLVNASYLRFDFSHFEKVSPEKLDEIEHKVNARIEQSIALEEHRSIDLERAKQMGAMALFGEKYSDQVRCIQFENSIELCGGTHVQNTSEIGLFKITSESSVASGIRRIEALTSLTAVEFLSSKAAQLDQIQQALKTKDVLTSISQLKSEKQALEKKVMALEKHQAMQLAEHLDQEAVDVDGVSVIAKKVEVSSSAQKDLIFALKNKPGRLIFLATIQNKKPTISLGISDDLVQSKGLHAGSIIKSLAQKIKGGGGGAPTFATAGGADASNLAALIEQVKSLKIDV